ncbi:MAG TPA: YtxH domain-containing protein [Polyangiaceae bacterium]|jgi:hypothetical protein|nr:YtxH domain-containing protein [Polyangiaceae bacterium]
MNTRKILISLGAALATSKIAKTISRLDADDVLGTVGLARRRNYLLQDIALMGAGAAIGAGVALLIAPTSGAETRAKIGKKFDELGDAAGDALRQVQNELPNLQMGRTTQNNAERNRERHEHHS